MIEKPKRKIVMRENLSKTTEETELTKEDSTLPKDRSERGYYYDDAYGYQKYVEESDDDQPAKESRNTNCE